MEQGYLIDTNIIIGYLNNSFTKEVNDSLSKIFSNGINISIITHTELFYKKDLPANELAILKEFVSLCNILVYNEEISDKAIEINLLSSLKRKLADTVIAATAIQNNLTLVSLNDNDFKGFKDLNYLNPNRLNP